MARVKRESGGLSLIELKAKRARLLSSVVAARFAMADRLRIENRGSPMFSRKLIGSIAIVAMVVGVATAAYAVQSGSGASATVATAPGSGGDGSNARSGPAAGGTAGIVDSVSASGFTVLTATGQKVTVNEVSSTTYQQGATSASASAITAGETVVVLGTTNSTTITATQVIVQPTGDYGSAASSTAGVVAFQQGAPSTAKQVGQIPATYNQGSGTIVSGTTANDATEAALAAYPGGVVDRVVELGDGEYEVHYIGVNWPHHVFVSPAFNVVGAN